jgi:hypothetical protein
MTCLMGVLGIELEGLDDLLDFGDVRIGTYLRSE